jgi:antitoxin component of RelBE/YafQ-DinJ toxin-antitoxin module
MSKKELIQIRVSGDEKLKIKTMARKKGMTVSEFVLYSLMRTISECEIYELLK